MKLVGLHDATEKGLDGSNEGHTVSEGSKDRSHGPLPPKAVAEKGGTKKTKKKAKLTPEGEESSDPAAQPKKKKSKAEAPMQWRDQARNSSLTV